jgi:ORF6N domain
MFGLTKEENKSLRSQNATLKQVAFSKYLPYAFTEHGVLMLSNVLKSGRAIEMSIKIIDVFVKLREMLLTHKDILLKLEQMERKIIGHDEDIQLIFKYLKGYSSHSRSQKLGSALEERTKRTNPYFTRAV